MRSGRWRRAGRLLDPAIVEALVRPVTSGASSTESEEALLALVAEGKPIKAIAAARGLPPEAVDAAVEAVFLKLAQGVSAGQPGSASAPATPAPGHRRP